MSRKTTSKPEPKKSTRAIADLSPSAETVTKVVGGALVKLGGVEGESTNTGHKGGEL